MAVYTGSRYIQTPIYARKGQAYIFNIRDKHKFNTDTATYYTVIKGDTIDGIAYQKYGNASLGWAILDANPQLMSEMDLTVGDILMIPNFNEVAKISE